MIKDAPIQKRNVIRTPRGITKDNINTRMLRFGIRSEKIYDPWVLPSQFLKVGIGINSSLLAKNISRQLQKKSIRTTHSEGGETGIHFDIKLIEIDIKVPKNGHLGLIFIFGGSISHNGETISGKFKMKFPVGGINMEILKLESHDTGQQMIYDLKLNLAGKNIDWVVSKITMFIPTHLKDLIIAKIIPNIDKEVILHAIRFDKNIDLPPLKEGGKPITIKSPLPNADNLSFTTNSFYKTLILGWTAGDSGMRDMDIKRISKKVCSSGKFIQVVMSPNFIYNEIAKTLKHFLGNPIFTPVNAQTVLIGGKNVFGVSVTDAKLPDVNLQLLKTLFTSKDNQLGAMAQIKGKASGISFDLGFYIGFIIGQLNGTKQDITVHIQEGYEDIELAWWQTALLASFGTVLFPLALAIAGALIDKKTANIRDNKIVFEYTLSDYAKLSDFSVIKTPHFLKGSYWISINFDTPEIL